MRELLAFIIGLGLYLTIGPHLLDVKLPLPQNEFLAGVLTILYILAVWFGGLYFFAGLALWVLERIWPPHETKAPTPLPMRDTTTLDLNREQDRATLKRLLQDDTPMFGGYPPDWDDIRQRVLQRDDYKCCNNPNHIGVLHVHHIVPLSKGGTNNLSNLKTVCERCHKDIHPHMR